jgi:hypothetical protein
MRRAVLICLLLSLSLAAPAAADQRAAVALERCATAAATDLRAATFVARMRRIAGAERMQLRFHLQHRAEGGAWRPAGALGSWRNAAPGVGAYVYTKRVEGLAVPGEYRVLVRFRWLDDEGAGVAAARRLSPRCAQPDPRANLRPVAVELEHQEDGRTRYGVRIRNTGLAAAGPFGVVFSVDGVALTPTGTAPALGAGDVTVVEVVGPACGRGAVVDVVVDPGLALDERREDDNALSAPCPAPEGLGRGSTLGGRP